MSDQPKRPTEMTNARAFLATLRAEFWSGSAKMFTRVEPVVSPDVDVSYRIFVSHATHDITRVAEVLGQVKRLRYPEIRGFEQEIHGNADNVPPPLVAVEAKRPAPSKIRRPAGSVGHDIARWLFSPKTCEQIFDQAIADMREESNASLAAGQHWHVRYVLARGYACLVLAAVAYVTAYVARGLSVIWKLTK
jgi:hypothetical protein